MKKRLPANAEFVSIPAQFGFEAWKTYAARSMAQALGILDKSHDAMFRAIYVDKKLDIRSPTFASLAEFYSQYGVSAGSPRVRSPSKRDSSYNDALIKAYGVESTPNFVINGKYLVTGQTAGGYASIEP
ncbi:hypothetical protein [Dokdonella sp.]|uniref:hypothetical protein n=1 Tax=Dokdonella sp. TaxID=2291710 RepID=UPI003529D1D0